MLTLSVQLKQSYKIFYTVNFEPCNIPLCFTLKINFPFNNYEPEGVLKWVGF